MAILTESSASSSWYAAASTGNPHSGQYAAVAWSGVRHL
jgi:hypothetical protein